MAVVLVLPTTLMAQSSTYSQRVGADTFVSSGQPNTSFGSQGAMEIAAPTTAQPRTQMAVMGFDTSSMQTSFNATYGVGNWVMTGVSLQLFSNIPLAGQQPNNGSFNRIAAGGFEFDLLSNNNWSESTLTWNTLPSILPGNNNNTLNSLGTFNWDATGATSSLWTLSASQSLLDEIKTGSYVTILGQPTSGSTVGYLFNSLASNPGFLEVTVEPVPEPSALAIVFGIMAVSVLSRSNHCTKRP